MCAKAGTGFRYVVNLEDKTCTSRTWQLFGKPCKHALAFINSIRNEKIQNYVDNYFSVQKFRSAYEGIIPAIHGKEMWPKSNHGFFMHPPLLISTSGRRKNIRFKAAIEGGRGNKGRHQCPICGQYGRHWHTCKNGDPADIGAIKLERYVTIFMYVLLFNHHKYDYES